MKKMPKELFIYLANIDRDGEPIYGVARTIEQIPEDSDGDKVGVYILNRQCAFRVRRELPE